MKLLARFLIMAALVCATTGTAFAQADGALVAALHPHIGKTVFVTDQTTVEKRGRLLDVSASSVVLLGDGSRQIRLGVADVRRVDVRTRSVAYGFIIGALAGAAVGVGTQLGGSHGEAIVGFTFVGALLGAGVNELFPHRRVLYRGAP